MKHADRMSDRPMGGGTQSPLPSGGPPPDRVRGRLADRVRAEMSRRIPLAVQPRVDPPELVSSWRAAKPARIAASLADALARDPGGWFVVGAATDFPAGISVQRVVDGREVVIWRDRSGALHAGHGVCPHLDAPLGDCPVNGGTLYCRWHGMALPDEAPRWPTYAAHDDGVLAWVRLPVEGESAGPDLTVSPLPNLPARPDLATALVGIVARRAVCEPRDIIANRLDPWHGAWYHPYAFSHLTVDEDASSPSRFVLDVSYRVAGPLAVPVRAEFVCPDARTIVMTITEGEGAGSVVETHATPLGADDRGRPVTVMTEATIATSPRRGFALTRALARGVVESQMRRAAARLWVDDLAYAERTYAVRSRPR